MTLGEKLRFFRTREGYLQREIADMLSIDRSTYSYYENEKILPGLYTVWRLAKLYRVSMEFLVDERLEPVGAKEFLKKEKDRKSTLKRKRIKYIG